MILPGRLAEEPESDEFGPGSDLVLSMFAVVILMLGIVGVGKQWAKPLPPDHEAVPIGRMAALEREKATLEGAKAALAADLAATRAKLAAAEASVKHALPVGGEATARALRDARADTETQKKRADENAAIARKLGLANLDLNDRLARRSRGREVVLADEEPGRAAFSAGGSRLTEAGRLQLIDRRQQLRDLFVGVDANVLMIEGRASIEPRARPAGQGPGDGALDLSADRAVAVAQALAVDLRLPFDCISVQGRGRSRSDLLFRKGSALPIAGFRLADIDDFFARGRKAGAESSVPAFKARFADQLRRDQVVVAFAAYDPGVPGCDAKDLRRVLEGAR